MSLFGRVSGAWCFCYLVFGNDLMYLPAKGLNPFYKTGTCDSDRRRAGNMPAGMLTICWALLCCFSPMFARSRGAVCGQRRRLSRSGSRVRGSRRQGSPKPSPDSRFHYSGTAFSMRTHTTGGFNSLPPMSSLPCAVDPVFAGYHLHSPP